MSNAPTKPFPFASFEHLTDGQTVGMIVGTLSILYGWKTGNNAKKPWAIQNGILTDDTGAELPVVFMDRESELGKEWKGVKIQLVAGTDKGLTGLYAYDDTFQGRTTRKLKVTKSAHLTAVGDAAPEQLSAAEQERRLHAIAEAHEREKSSRGQTTHELAERPPQQRQQHQQQTPAANPEPGPDLSGPTPPAGKKSPEEIEAEKAKAEKRDIRDARHAMIQVANLHLMSRLCVENYEAKTYREVTGNDMSESEKQGATASIFIQLTKTQVHLKMPKRPFTVDELKKA